MNLVEIEKALTFADSVCVFPDGLFAEGRNQEKWKEVREDPFHKKSLGILMKSGEKYINEPIRSLPFSKYKIFDTTGSRKEYESEYFDHRGRLNTFALLSLVHGEQKYLEALEDAIWAVCDEYSWCLPAHFGGGTLDTIEKSDLCARIGKKNNLREHDRIVDLFTAETGFALAEICELLDDRLAPIVVHRARKLVLERVLESYQALDSMFGWEVWGSNWAAVCGGSVGIAAIYLLRDSQVLAPIILRLLSAMEAFLGAYADDGGCTEGLGYWNYGFGFYVQFVELLKQRTAGRIDWLSIPKVKAIALFQQKCHMGGNRTVSFSDGDAETRFQPGLTSLLKERFDEVDVPTVTFRACFADDPCYRWGTDIRNFVWSNPKMKGGINNQASYYLPDAKWLVSHAKSKGIHCCFAAKGGKNNEPHNHNDIGSFIFQIGGEQVFIDAGAGEYTKQYFGPDRYSHFCSGSQGHSVPIVEGLFQKEGEYHYAVVTEQSSTKEKDVFEIDMAKAYPADNLISLIRRWEFQKASDIKLLLIDKYLFANHPGAIVERFVSHLKPELIHPGKVQYNCPAGTLNVVYDPDILEFGISGTSYSGHAAREVKAYCMDLRVKMNSTETYVEVEFSVTAV